MTTVQRIELADTPMFDEFYDAYAASYDRDFDQPYARLELDIELQSDAYQSAIVLVARDDAGRVAGGAWAELPHTDNTGFAYVEVFVIPARRREGHGRALTDALVAVCRDAGRTTMLGEAAWGVGDSEAPARELAEACGFALDIMDAHRALRLPATLPPLVVDPAYTIHSWRDACPEQWIGGYADLRHVMVQEAPSGDAGLENEHWDADRIRHEESRWNKQGREAQVSVAVAPDGTVVGHTQLLFPKDSDEVMQWDTLVLPSHRGHGLGLALKVFTMLESADLLDGRHRIHTYNADSNGPMIAVNEAMGFRQIAWVGEYVRTI